jgi:hypothetical protein
MDAMVKPWHDDNKRQGRTTEIVSAASMARQSVSDR